MASARLGCLLRAAPAHFTATRPSKDRDVSEEHVMPLYMDVHHIEGGVKATDVAQAHEADLQVQGKHAVDYQKYWVDEEAGTIYCLVSAPGPEAANTVHREAHGLVADEIHEVV